MPPPSPVPLPADCRVETLAEWLGDAYAEAGMYVGPRGKEGRAAMARAVRALVEDRVRAAIARVWAEETTDTFEETGTDRIVSRVLGSPS